MKISNFYFVESSTSLERLTSWKGSLRGKAHFVGAWRFLLLGVLVGMIVLVGAEPIWNSTAYNAIYHFSEDDVSFHNFTTNLSDSSDLSHFLILDISWINGALGPTHSDFYWLPWNDSGFLNSTSGVLNMTPSFDNETGNFTLNVYAQGDQTGTAVKFDFLINATNDAPNFTNLNLSLVYDFPQDESVPYIINAADEESHYPLDFNLTFYNCTHASWSGRAEGENCSIFNLTYNSATSTKFDFDPVYDEVGTYFAYFSVSDFNGTCPHAYCDVSSYEENKTSEVYNLTFNVYSSLTINVSNCSGATVMEGETFNCTINITTRGEEDELDFSSYAFFSSNPAMSYDESNRDWFYADATDNASNFFYSLPVSITPTKSEVGNWTINFSVDSVSDDEVGQIEIFVNYTESNVSLNVIGDVQLYEDGNFSVDAYDEDLLIWDSNIKDEVLVFSSNTSWVSAGVGSVVSGNNYSSSIISINHSYVMNNISLGEGNYSVNVSVVDNASNLDWKVFNIEILNESAPVWDESLSDPVVLELIENESFVYNVSVNVTDPGETIVFYYENVSAEFCSLTVSNFNSSSGVISFTPTDCDVGYHDVTIISGNGKLNSSWDFVFNVSNIADAPIMPTNTFTGDNGTAQTNLNEGVSFIAPEGVAVNFSLVVDDDDFLIPEGQKSYYNESLNVSVTFENSSGSFFNFFNFSFVEFGNPNDESVSYNATFTAEVGDVGNYVVVVNITDVAGNSTNRTFYLNVTESLEAPVLGQVDNVSLTIHDYVNFSVNATDDEDDYLNLSLSYFVVALDLGAPNLTVGIVNGSIEFNMSSNQSYDGIWGYNVSVVDSNSSVDWQVFYLSVYGLAWNVSVLEDFSLTENVSSVLNFTINHSVGDNLTYEFWIDDMSCLFQNNSNCSYGNLSLRELNSSFGDGSIFGWSFVPDFGDESYGREKNLTVKVYPNSSLLSSNQSESVAVNFSFKLNISHTNAPMRAVAPVGLLQSDYNSNINVDLSGYFADEDVSDTYYLQNVSFVKSAQVGGGDIFVTHSSGWDIIIGTTLKTVHDDFISITGSDNLTSDIIEDIEVKFVAPTTTSTPSSGGSSGSSTKLKFYSLRIIVPEDVIISDENYIEIPFGLENSGMIDLSGIDLSSEVLYNNEFSDDVKIELGETYVDVLKAGERRDYTMKILADTDRSGRYKATIFANISSPKFMDWGDFFIDLRRTNESEAEELLIFTEKIIADNPECLELTEIFRRAQEAFESGDEAEAVKLAMEVSAACEDAISANEQIRYRIEGFVEKNFYYISFVTLMIFFAGFVVYVYKRVRFNKSAEGVYVK